MPHPQVQNPEHPGEIVVKIVFQLARIDNFGNLDPNVVSDGTYGPIQRADIVVRDAKVGSGSI